MTELISSPRKMCCYLIAMASVSTVVTPMASVSTVATPMAMRNLKPIATVASSSYFPFPITNGKLIKETTYSITIQALQIFKENKKRNSSKLSQSFLLGHSYQSFCLPPNSAAEEAYAQDDHFVVVNFYRFVFIGDPLAEVSRHLSFLEGLDICGRIYLNEQGINAQYSGPRKDAVAYMEWLREDHRFSDALFQISRTSNVHAFPKLKLRYKPSLVQFEGGISHLPIIDDSMRATPLTPFEWRQRLEEVDRSDEVSRRKSDSNVVLLDVRNGYEWDIGHFCGAKRPDVDCFRSTSFGLTHLEDNASDPLANADKEETEVLMYCTGGIRCDVYSTILRQRGFKKLYTLKGGVSHYLKEEGPVHWVGNLFVFDSRLSLPPPTQTSNTINEVNEAWQLPNSTSFSRCSICSSQLSELRHRNCANLDCNLLFLCCGDCQDDLKGCCCKNCTNASRLRPLLSGNQRYEKWHHYRDQDSQRT